MISTLKEFGRGQITLPKKWRDQFGTEHYIAKETGQGLLIIPLTDQVLNLDKVKLNKDAKAAKSAAKTVFKRKTIRAKKKR